MSVYGNSDKAAKEIYQLKVLYQFMANKLTSEKYLKILAPDIPVINFKCSMFMAQDNA